MPASKHASPARSPWSGSTTAPDPTTVTDRQPIGTTIARRTRFTTPRGCPRRPRTRRGGGLPCPQARRPRPTRTATPRQARPRPNLTHTHRQQWQSHRIRLLAYTNLDGTLIPINSLQNQKDCHCGEQCRHGMSMQVIADAANCLVRASAPLAGAAHDLTAVRAHGIIRRLTSAEVMTLEDSTYPARRHPAYAAQAPPISDYQSGRKSYKGHATPRIRGRGRGRGDRAIATLRTWNCRPDCAAVRPGRPRSCRLSRSCTTPRTRLPGLRTISW